MKRCHFCAEEIQDAAIKCKHCGSYTGQKDGVHDADNKCMYCGSSIEQKTDTVKTDNVTKKEGEKHWSAVKPCFCLMIFSFLSIIFLSTENAILVIACSFMLFACVVVISALRWLFSALGLSTFDNKMDSKIKYCIEAANIEEDLYDDWELGFLDSIQAETSFSRKQKNMINKLHDMAFDLLDE